MYENQSIHNSVPETGRTEQREGKKCTRECGACEMNVVIGMSNLHHPQSASPKEEPSSSSCGRSMPRKSFLSCHLRC